MQGLEWVMYRPRLLAVLTAPASLMLWDPRGGAVVWQKDLSASEPFMSLVSDPLDCRRLAACGASGSLSVFTFNKVRVRVDDCKLTCEPDAVLLQLALRARIKAQGQCLMHHIHMQWFYYILVFMEVSIWTSTHTAFELYSLPYCLIPASLLPWLHLRWMM